MVWGVRGMVKIKMSICVTNPIVDNAMVVLRRFVQMFIDWSAVQDQEFGRRFPERPDLIATPARRHIPTEAHGLLPRSKGGKPTADRGPDRWPLPAGLTRKDFLPMSLDQPDQGPEPHEPDEQLLQQLVEHVRKAVELMRFSNFVIPPDGDPEA